MKLPNLPPGSKVHLDRFVNQGSGTMTIDHSTFKWGLYQLKGILKDDLGGKAELSTFSGIIPLR